MFIFKECMIILCGKRVSKELQLQIPSWYTIAMELRKKFKQFVNFVDADSSMHDYHYVVTNGYGGSKAFCEGGKPGIITVFVDGCPTEFEPPDQSGMPHASNVTYSSLQLNWDTPKYDINIANSDMHDTQDQWTNYILTELTSRSLNCLLEMPCLGRPFQLGTLYDCRSDSLIPGVTLWGP